MSKSASARPGSSLSRTRVRHAVQAKRWVRSASSMTSSSPSMRPAIIASTSAHSVVDACSPASGDHGAAGGAIAQDATRARRSPLAP